MVLNKYIQFSLKTELQVVIEKEHVNGQMFKDK